MKTLNAVMIALALAFHAHAADSLTEKLQRGLFEEEANHNLDAAIKEYQSVIAQSDEQRKVTATALFRLGECYRKLGKTNEANAHYQRILRDFSEQEQLVAAIRATRISVPGKEAKVGTGPASELEREEARLSAELDQTNTQLNTLNRLQREKQFDAAAQVSGDESLVTLRKQLREVDQKIATTSTTFSEEHPEMQRLKVLRQTILRQSEEALNGLIMAEKNRGTALMNDLETVRGQLLRTAGTMTQAESEELTRVKTLARNSPDLLDTPYKESLTSLQWAAQQGFPTVLEFLLAQGLDVNGPERKMPPIVLAAQRGHLRIVQLLLERGADVNAGLYGFTALMGAVQQGFKAVAELLLAKGADVKIATSGNSTALHLATSRGDSNMVALLLARNADPNMLANASNPQSYSKPGPDISNSTYDTYNGATPLHHAARHSSPSIAEMLVKAGARANATNWAGTSPLHIAVAVEQTNIMRLLFANGADPNLRNSQGDTPLALAISKSAGLTRALIVAGAKVDEPAYRRPNWMVYPLHLAASGEPSSLRVLLEAKPDLEVVNSEGYTPLWSALISSASGTNAQLLIEAGADLRRKLGRQSPLQYAVSRAPESVVSSMLKAGADANEQDESGNSLLHYAVGRTSGIVRVLLENGAKPNVLNKDLQTPLSFVLPATRSPRAPSLNVPGSPGNPPAQPSAEDDRQQIVALLKQHGADEFMQRRLRIGARRGPNTYPIFTRGTNVLNRFTLMELLGSVFQFGSLREPGRFSWPDLDNLRIHRIKGTNPSVLTVKLSEALKNGDCRGDQWLEWGDEVEIPERIHPLDAAWDALSGTEARTLTNCMARTVRVSVSGTNINVRLQPYVRSENEPRWLSHDKFSFAFLPIILRNERELNRHLRSASDLSRVTVRRTDLDTKELRTMTFDVTEVTIPNATSGSTPLDHTLWLRDGDVIEIPER